MTLSLNVCAMGCYEATEHFRAVYWLLKTEMRNPVVARPPSAGLLYALGLADGMECRRSSVPLQYNLVRRCYAAKTFSRLSTSINTCWLRLLRRLLLDCIKSGYAQMHAL